MQIAPVNGKNIKFDSRKYLASTQKNCIPKTDSDWSKWSTNPLQKKKFFWLTKNSRPSLVALASESKAVNIVADKILEKQDVECAHLHGLERECHTHEAWRRGRRESTNSGDDWLLTTSGTDKDVTARKRLSHASWRDVSDERNATLNRNTYN